MLVPWQLPGRRGCVRSVAQGVQLQLPGVSRSRHGSLLPGTLPCAGGHDDKAHPPIHPTRYSSGEPDWAPGGVPLLFWASGSRPAALLLERRPGKHQRALATLTRGAARKPVRAPCALRALRARQKQRTRNANPRRREARRVRAGGAPLPGLLQQGRGRAGDGGGHRHRGGGLPDDGCARARVCAPGYVPRVRAPGAWSTGVARHTSRACRAPRSA